MKVKLDTDLSYKKKISRTKLTYDESCGGEGVKALGVGRGDLRAEHVHHQRLVGRVEASYKVAGAKEDQEKKLET